MNSIAPIIALASNPFWGAVADRWQIHRQILALCAFVSGLVTLFFLQVTDFWLLLILVTTLTFFRAPISSIVDSTVMDIVKRANHNYGQQRLWGTVGFVLATFGLGNLLTLTNQSLLFWLHSGLLGLICASLSFFLPITGVHPETNLRHSLRVLIRHGSYLSFLLSMMLVGMGIASYAGFLGLHILAIGGSEQQVGLAWAVIALPEIPMMYFGGYWFVHRSRKQLILAGCLGFALVWTLAALAPSPTLLIGVVSGIGVCFGFFWVAAVGYASEAAPPNLNATAQALMGAAQGGLGWSLGSVIAGYLWDHTNGHVVLSFTVVCMILAALIFWLGNRA